MRGDAELNNVTLVVGLVRVSIGSGHDDFRHYGVGRGFGKFISLDVGLQLKSKATGYDVIFGEFAGLGYPVGSLQIAAEGFLVVVRQVAVKQAAVHGCQICGSKFQIALAQSGRGRGLELGRCLRSEGTRCGQAFQFFENLVITRYLRMAENGDAQRPGKNGKAGGENECQKPPEPRHEHHAKGIQ